MFLQSFWYKKEKLISLFFLSKIFLFIFRIFITIDVYLQIYFSFCIDLFQLLSYDEKTSNSSVRNSFNKFSNFDFYWSNYLNSYETLIIHFSKTLIIKIVPMIIISIFICHILFVFYWSMIFSSICPIFLICIDFILIEV